jgi:hypothetical protein
MNFIGGPFDGLEVPENVLADHPEKTIRSYGLPSGNVVIYWHGESKGIKGLHFAKQMTQGEYKALCAKIERDTK